MDPTRSRVPSRGLTGPAWVVAALRPQAASVAALVVLVGAGLFIQLGEAVNHDVAWLLLSAQRLLDGADLYVDDVVEPSPPLAIALLALPVALAGAADATAILWFRLLTLAMIGGSLLLANALLGVLLAGRAAALRFAVVTAWAFFLSIGVAEFGQREHWMASLMAPYLVAAAANAAGVALPRRPALAAGLLAGLAFSLKPHYLLVVAALELWGALARGARPRLRPELAAIGATCGAYAGAVWLLTPAYYERIVPLLREAYTAYQQPRLSLVKASHLSALALSAAAALSVRAGPARTLAITLWIAAAACYGAHLVQATGWSYHLEPYRAPLYPLLACVAWDWLRRLRLPRRSVAPGRAAAAVAAGLVSALLLAPFPAGRTLRRPGPWLAGRGAGPVAQMRDFLVDHAAGRNVFFLSTGVLWAFPAVTYAGVGWTSRFSCLWLLPAAAGDGPAAAAIAEMLRDAVVADLRRRPPQLIFVDVAEQQIGFDREAIDLLAWFQRDPRFQHIFDGYDFARQLGQYRVYRRRAANAGPGPPHR